MGHIHQYLNQQEECRTVQLAGLHQHFGKAAGLLFHDRLNVLDVVHRRKFLPDNTGDKIHILLMPLNVQPLFHKLPHQLRCGRVVGRRQFIQSFQHIRGKVDGAFQALFRHNKPPF